MASSGISISYLFICFTLLVTPRRSPHHIYAARPRNDPQSSPYLLVRLTVRTYFISSAYSILIVPVYTELTVLFPLQFGFQHTVFSLSRHRHSLIERTYWRVAASSAHPHLATPIPASRTENPPARRQGVGFISTLAPWNWFAFHALCWLSQQNF